MLSANGKSQLDVWGAAIRTYLVIAGTLSAARHPVIFKKKKESQRVSVFTRGVSKIVKVESSLRRKKFKILWRSAFSEKV